MTTPDENEYVITDDGRFPREPREDNLPDWAPREVYEEFVGYFADEDGEYGEEVMIGLAKKQPPLRESQLSADEMKLFDKAKQKEFNTVLFEKKALRKLSPQEAAWVRATHPERVMSSLFALKWKEEAIDGETAGEKEAKARLAVRGCGDPDLAWLAWQHAVQSPTLSFEGKSLLYQMCAAHKWRLNLGDVKGAFMESPPLNREHGAVYMSLPKGGVPGTEHGPDDLYEIVLPLYGLNDSPQRWWSTVKHEVKSGGGQESKFDSCLYYCRDLQGNLTDVLGHHVDDFIGGGAGPEWEKLVAHLRKRFPFRKWSTTGGDFCGCRVRQLDDYSIVYGQRDFIQKMKGIQVPKGVNLDDPVPPAVLKQLRGVLGSGNWAANQSRPDIAVLVSQAMQTFPTPTWRAVVAANNMFRRSKQDADLEIRVHHVAPHKLRILASSDAAQHNAKDEGTQGGYIIGFSSDDVLLGRTGPWSPAVWKSYRLRRAAASTMSSETQACRDCCSHAAYLANMLEEALNPKYSLITRNECIRNRPAVNVVDCKSLYDHGHSLCAASTGGSDKLTAIEIVILREIRRDTGITIRWGPGEVQIADGLTKDKEEPAVRLRGVLRGGQYQLAEAGAVLRQNKLEKELKAARKAAVAKKTTTTSDNTESPKGETKEDVDNEKVVSQTRRWGVRKAVYGLNASPQQWTNELKHNLK